MARATAPRVTLANPLRAGVAIGDQVVLDNPMTVFRLFDDEQGVMQIEAPMIGRIGIKLIEVLP